MTKGARKPWLLGKQFSAQGRKGGGEKEGGGALRIVKI